jgi:general secretion pathway protein E
MNAPTSAPPVLIESISPALLANARQEAVRTGKKCIAILEEEAGLEPSLFTSALGMAFGLTSIDMAELDGLMPALDVLPLTEALSRGCIAVRDSREVLFIVYSDPFDQTLRPWLEERIAARFSWRLAHSADLQAYLSRLEAAARTIHHVPDEAGSSERADEAVHDITFRNIADDPSPVIKFVNSALFDALKSDASDVHFEITGYGLVVKYRLDGVLVEASTLKNLEMAHQVIARIKVLAELDISERRVPQDGRFRASFDQRLIDFRVSVMPSIFGEDAVIRILDKRSLVDQTMELRLEALGFDEPTIAILRKLSKEAYGMLLVTGPTGSGKTTTLYATLSEVNNGEDKIVTIEDPVEYQLQGVLQIPVNERKGLTFARGLRSILRHDPDKILVGEIRDTETAEIAVQAALTGHLVFTTVHANNVFDVIGRFTHMGVDPYSFVSAINGIVAQRLVRLACSRCAKPYAPSRELLWESGLKGQDISSFQFVAGTGCGQCRGTGYKGRKAIAEVLLLDEDVRDLIVSRASTKTLREAAKGKGTVFLREAALNLVRRGETTLQAINRVTLA